MSTHSSLISSYVRDKLYTLHHTAQASYVAATLAKLRRGLGKEAGSVPDLWEITLSGLPEKLQGRSDEPSYAEQAVHSSLALYALHQQGRDIQKQFMHKDKVSLGRAIRRLINQNNDREDALTRRFLTTVTSDSYEELNWHLRSLIQLLRSGDVKLDYANLASDLHHFQFTDHRDALRLRWGRQFYQIVKSEQEEVEEGTQSEEE